jgi:hypothetical protein
MEVTKVRREKRVGKEIWVDCENMEGVSWRICGERSDWTI